VVWGHARAGSGTYPIPHVGRAPASPTAGTGVAPGLHPRRRGAGRSRVLPPVPRRPRTTAAWPPPAAPPVPKGPPPATSPDDEQPPR